jgi:hypothetical protein
MFAIDSPLPFHRATFVPLSRRFEDNNILGWDQLIICTPSNGILYVPLVFDVVRTMLCMTLLSKVPILVSLCHDNAVAVYFPCLATGHYIFYERFSWRCSAVCNTISTLLNIFLNIIPKPNYLSQQWIAPPSSVQHKTIMCPDNHHLFLQSTYLSVSWHVPTTAC